jgi:hypothetical protein
MLDDHMKRRRQGSPYCDIVPVPYRSTIHIFFDDRKPRPKTSGSGHHARSESGSSGNNRLQTGHFQEPFSGPVGLVRFYYDPATVAQAKARNGTNT